MTYALGSFSLELLNTVSEDLAGLERKVKMTVDKALLSSGSKQ